ncbi:MAG: hypothetical protein ACI93S_001199 [Ancylomarina sp.]|jgi:hypothetical protein
MKKVASTQGIKKIEIMFDTLLIQTVKRDISYEEYVELDANGEFYGEFEQLNSWKQQFGYTFHIYTDHLINDKQHFHLDNKEKNIHLKLDFEGNILEDKGNKRIDQKVHKVLKKFLLQPNVIIEWNKMWNKNNNLD